MARTSSGTSSPGSGDHKRCYHHSVFPASHAGHLDSRIRRFIYHPDRLAEQYVKQGDRVLDFGCGPGFFTREFAKKTGETGVVIAVDSQEEMLRLLREKLEPEGLMPRIRPYHCNSDSLGLSPEKDGQVDVAFAIFVVHEVPDAGKLFHEIATVLVPGGLLFYTEPLFVVSGNEFRDNLALAVEAGLRVIETRMFFINRAAVLKKE